MAISKQSTWEDLKPLDRYPKFKGEAEADVVIVGGGLCGILTAYFLNQAGRSVILLEKSALASGATQLTTAFITKVVDTHLTDLIKMFGRRKAKLVWESGQKAITTIAEIVKKEKITCDFRSCSDFIYANDKKELEDLNKEYASAKKLGFDVNLRNPDDFGFKSYGILEIKDQAKFHPLKFLNELAKKASIRGVQIYEKSEVVEIKESQNRIYTRTKNGMIVSKDVVIATYQPFNNPIQTFLKKGMYKSYVMEVELKDNEIPEGIYEDLHSPYHYFRIDNRNRMIVGGEDHRMELKMQDQTNFKALEEYLRSLIDDGYKVLRKWTGPILEPTDGLALIGSFRKHQYVATAFSGNGMTYSTIAGILLTDLILQRKNSWATIYDPKRVPTLYQLYKKVGDCITEFTGGALKNMFNT